MAFDAQFSDPDGLTNLHLVRYEMRDHGRSDKPEYRQAYKSVRYAEDFYTVCKAFDLKKPCMLVWQELRWYQLRLLITKSIVLGIIPIDVVETYGADAISGVLYVGGAPLSLKSAPPTFPQTFLPLLDAIVSTDATVAAKTAAWFVDSCVAHPKLDLPWPRKLQWMGSFGSQPPQIRQYMMTRTQNEARWLAEASI
ncbi:hypothetical protein AcW1_008090 [Taiwanofungus camphoratus]|nr:hypothetical protein AcW1_008090 [Antrodia cinnamomea]